MAFKLGNLPNKGAKTSELADFLEVQCLLSDEKSYSITSAKSALGIAEETTIEGIDSEEDKILSAFEEALAEINSRNYRCNGLYPFKTTPNSIQIKEDVNQRVLNIYTYLLFATREDMGTNRVHDTIDGANLFESFCSYVLNSFFGENSKTMIFGTSESTRPFKYKIDELLTFIGEGGAFKSPQGSNYMQKDGKLDVVVSIPFKDKRLGSFLAFGQCKTGTNWSSLITQLAPRAFLNSYTTFSPGFTPLRVFLITEMLLESWEEHIRFADGLFFDRSRLMTYLPQTTELDTPIQKWTESVIKSYKQEA